MSRFKDYLHYAQYGMNKSFRLFLLEEALNIKITPIHFHGWIDATRWNEVFSGELEGRIYYTEDGDICESIIKEFASEEKGGIIIFSTDVNANIKDKKSFRGKVQEFIKKNFQTIVNRLAHNKKLTKLFSSEEFRKSIKGFSVGNFFTGRYVNKDTGKIYDEKSLSVEIIDISFPTLIAVAEAIAKEFNQEAVLVMDHDKGRILLVNADKE